MTFSWAFFNCENDRAHSIHVFWRQSFPNFNP
jgi:hypothetical protein